MYGLSSHYLKSIGPLIFRNSVDLRLTLFTYSLTYETLFKKA
jgi:hypothetical protein